MVQSRKVRPAGMLVEVGESGNMSSADVLGAGNAMPRTADRSADAAHQSRGTIRAEDTQADSHSAAAAAAAGSATNQRERFLPITRFALRDRLTASRAWPNGQAVAARRFFLYLDYWRRQSYSAELHELEQTYEPFSPDSDLLMTRQFTNAERAAMQRRVVDQMQGLLERANYQRISTAEVTMILTRDSHYGLDLHVDLDAFEELLIFFRGAVNRRDQRRSMRKFGRREQFDVPIFQRLFVLFKLKPFDARVREMMAKHGIAQSEAERIVGKLRSLIPGSVKDDNIYMKLFKNMPRSDVEMIFPNTRVKFRLLDKVKLGVTGGGAFGMGIAGTAGKIAAGGIALSNPVALAGAVAGLGGIAFRQGMAFLNTRQRYMMVMAQNLYFHAMADNRGVMVKLAARAAEEDVKEEMLLYSVLAKEKANRRDLPAIDLAIEQYMANSFGLNVNFDIDDALGRLLRDGIVVEHADGTLQSLPPGEAAAHIDRKWDSLLDQLADLGDAEGVEVADDAGRPASRTS